MPTHRMRGFLYKKGKTDMDGNELVIIRNSPHEHIKMPYHHLFDARLSLKAKGLLSLVFSLPSGSDYEEFSIKDLIECSKDGRDATMNALKELEFYGYFKRCHKREIDGCFTGCQYVFFDIPEDMLEPKEEF